MSDDTPTVVPTMRYNDAPVALEWLVRVLGFARYLVIEGKHGLIDHAQLRHGPGMIMLASARDDDFGRLVQPPINRDMIGTQSVYLIVADTDAHYAHAVAQGAEIVSPISSPEHGGRFYSCRDPEGHLWGIGSYDPWDESAVAGNG